MPPLLIAAIVLGVCAYLFIFPGTDLEFEYLFVNGELDIDKIMAKSKRKRVKSLNITECEKPTALRLIALISPDGTNALGR